MENVLIILNGWVKKNNTIYTMNAEEIIYEIYTILKPLEII